MKNKNKNENKSKNEKTIKYDKDEIFEGVQKVSQKDNEIMTPVLEKILNIISDELDADNGFTVRQGYIALTKSLVYLSQALCENEEFFKNEINVAQKIALEKVIPSMLPSVEDGKDIDENYDMEDLSVRRLMMALAQAGEYIIWRMLVSNLQEMETESNDEKTESNNVKVKKDNKKTDVHNVEIDTEKK